MNTSKALRIAFLLFTFIHPAFADGLPIITLSPQNQTVAQGGTATFTVTATGADGYQWRFNGSDLSGETNSTLIVTNVQVAKSGYYVVIAKNPTGWVPSWKAYLAYSGPPGGSAGIVPLSNMGGVQAVSECDSQPVHGTVRVMAGPQLDQMQLFGTSTTVNNGFFNGPNKSITTVAPGQTVYYRVDFTQSVCAFFSLTQHSTVLELTAGGDGFPVPSTLNLKFPAWPEWPEPVWISSYVSYISSDTNQVRIPGETFTLTNFYFCYTDFGRPTAHWRKDGYPIPAATNFVQVSGDPGGGFFMTTLTVTNLQTADAGIYDVVVLGNDWIVAPVLRLSVQTANGPGVFVAPRRNNSSFLADLIGVAGRNYQVQRSTNLFDWSDLVTLSNLTGTVTFSNAPVPSDLEFYRTRLLP